MTGILNLLMGTVRSAVVTDPYFEYTTLLLPGNGTNLKNNNEFLDSSTNAFTITRNPLTGPNAPTQGTFSPFSQTGWGNYFNGSSRLSSTTGNVLNWGTNNFTVEMWVYLTTTSSNMMLLEGPSNNDFQLFVESGILKAGFGGAGVSVSYTLPSTFANTWNHIAVVRSGTSTNQTALYVNGVSQSTGTWSSSGAATGFQIARTSAYTLYGYVSGVRVIQNQALTSGNFTPPTAQVTTSSVGWTGANVAGSLTGTVSLLLCTSNRFVDSSGTVSTITIGGSPSVQAFSPFNPTASWSAATYGGSGYFDGNGDYLAAGSNAAWAMSTGDFSIEFWTYPTVLGVDGGYVSADYTTGFHVAQASGTLYFWVANSQINATSALSVNQWQHVVCTRASGTSRIFVNGVLKQTGANTNSVAQNSLYIGTSSHALTEEITGYLANVRVVKGQIPTTYTTSSTTIGAQIFTPPTSPLTTSSQGVTASNTSLLLNFTNAGIYDATSKNDLETVGNAQISTAISAKWGSGSIYLDGTNSRFNFSPANLFILGTAAFTFETWFYPVAAGGSGTIFTCKLSGGRGFYLVWSTGSVLRLLVNAGTNWNVDISSSALTLNTWHHIAVTRSGSTFYLLADGSLANSQGGVSGEICSTVPIVKIGSDDANGSLMTQSYLQDTRFTNGIARYTGAYTVPTAAFPTL